MGFVFKMFRCIKIKNYVYSSHILLNVMRKEIWEVERKENWKSMYVKERESKGFIFKYVIFCFSKLLFNVK